MPAQDEEGWVLLEVLVALVVLGLALAGMGDALSNSISVTRAASARQQAVLSAQSLLAQACASNPMVEGENSGEGWRVSISRSSLNPTGIPTGPSLLPVLWEVKGWVRGVTLSTMVLGDRNG